MVAFEDNAFLLQSMLSAFVFEKMKKIEKNGLWKWGIINLLPQMSLLRDVTI